MYPRWSPNFTHSYICLTLMVGVLEIEWDNGSIRVWLRNPKLEIQVRSVGECSQSFQTTIMWVERLTPVVEPTSANI